MAAKKTAKKAAAKAAKRKVAKAKPAKKAAKKSAKKIAKKAVKAKPAKKVVKKAAKAKSAKKSAKRATKSSRKSVKSTIKKPAAKAVAKRVAGAKGSSVKKAAAKPSVSTSVSDAPPKKPKCPLTRGELNEFRRLLVDKRRSLIGDMNGMEGNSLGRNMQESSGDLSNMPTHPADIGSDNFEHEFTLGLLESERELLEEINNALSRIETKWYGICLGTGEPIPKARLKIKPWCKYGIDYQRKIEKGLVRAGDDDLFGD